MTKPEIKREIKRIVESLDLAIKHHDAIARDYLLRNLQALQSFNVGHVVAYKNARKTLKNFLKRID